jgi:hypothetical protein
LLGRDDIAAVAVDEDDAPEAVGDHVLGQVDQQIHVHARRRRHGAGEIEMMVRVAEPHERREQDAILDWRFLDAAQHFAKEHTVGEDGHVPAVLFERGNRNHDRRIFGQAGDHRPGHFKEFHGILHSPPLTTHHSTTHHGAIE